MIRPYAILHGQVGLERKPYVPLIMKTYESLGGSLEVFGVWWNSWSIWTGHSFRDVVNFWHPFGYVGVVSHFFGMSHEIQYIGIKPFLQVVYFRRTWRQILGILVAFQKLSPTKSLTRSWKAMKPNSTWGPIGIAWCINMIWLFLMCWSRHGLGRNGHAPHEVAFQTSAAGLWVLWNWMVYHSLQMPWMMNAENRHVNNTHARWSQMTV